jgi:hypothetical protein
LYLTNYEFKKQIHSHNALVMSGSL